MTKKQIDLVENSWDFIMLNTDETGATFYRKLFEMDSSLRSLFKEDFDVQSSKLISMITFVVHKLNSLEEIIEDINALGKRHAGYHVRTENFNTVAAAFLSTLEEALQDRWNDEIKAAWVAAYTILSQTMIKAMHERIPQ